MRESKIIEGFYGLLLRLDKVRNGKEDLDPFLENLEEVLNANIIFIESLAKTLEEKDQIINVLTNAIKRDKMFEPPP